MPSLQPTKDQIRSFARDTHDGSVVMVNLLKFHATAQYRPEDPEHGDDISGEQAYGRYNADLLAFTSEPQIGLTVLYEAPVAGYFIGEGDWDKILAVRYPTRQHFLTMTSDPRYRAAHRHRAAGLKHQDLIETRPQEA